MGISSNDVQRFELRRYNSQSISMLSLLKDQGRMNPVREQCSDTLALVLPLRILLRPGSVIFLEFFIQKFT